MELTAQNVEATLKYCLFDSGEDTTGYKHGQSIRLNAGYHPGRIEEKKADIAALCDQLPDEFKEGWSFLNACITKGGVQWGEHEDIDNLLSIGLAAGCLEYLMPRELWQSLPGGMPYFKIVK